MLSNRLKLFLTAWCHADLDDDEVTELLRTDDQFVPWLAADLTMAIHGGDITPQVGRRLTGIGFQDQPHVDRWLRQRWADWFPGEPYPQVEVSRR